MFFNSSCVMSKNIHLSNNFTNFLKSTLCPKGNSKYYRKNLKRSPVKSRNIKTLFQKRQQSTKESTKTTSVTLINLSSEAAADDDVQLTLTLVSVQPTST